MAGVSRPDAGASGWEIGVCHALSRFSSTDTCVHGHPLENWLPTFGAGGRGSPTWVAKSGAIWPSIALHQLGGREDCRPHVPFGHGLVVAPQGRRRVAEGKSHPGGSLVRPSGDRLPGVEPQQRAHARATARRALDHEVATHRPHRSSRPPKPVA
jgi:hypothetical protein